MTKKLAVFEELERIAAIIPYPLYWHDTNFVLLGANETIIKAVGGSRNTVIGKTPYEFYSPEEAEAIVQNCREVIATKKVLYHDESIKDITTGETKYFTGIRGPIFDEKGNVVGIIGTSIDITDRKEKEQQRIEFQLKEKRLNLEKELQKIKLEEQLKFKKLVDQAAEDTGSNLAVLLVLAQHCTGLTKKDVFETIERLADDAPINLYWLDDNNVVLGANKQDVEAVGAIDYIGKTQHELFPSEMADKIVEHNNLVMRTRKVLSQEEVINDITTGEIKYFTSFKAPLYDDNGKVIGILGTSVDITAEKDAERLKLENELQKIKIQEQERFAMIANQVAHDIRSPLTTLQTVVGRVSKSLLEKDRVGLNSITRSITDVANNLLNSYKKANDEVTIETTEPQPVLVSLELSKIASEKRHQYANSPVKINDLYKPNSGFVFIKADPSNFDRMISNLVNNAVDTFEGKKGKVDLNLSVKNEHVKVVVEDNGKGMPQKIIDKITNNIAVTSGKKDGNGIGFIQIRSTLQLSKGSMLIKSKIGKGTKITLTFPITGAPDWIAQQIVLHKGDIVVVLDDDPSIHYAWDTRFEDYKNKNIVSLKHFKLGEKAIAFINAQPKKHKIFLLSDFELINQELNGLEVIERVSMQQQSVLVTSHHANTKVYDLAAKIGVKILPKQLAAEVLIKIEKREKGTSSSKKGYLVIIDDIRQLADSVADLLRDKFAGVGVYYHPKRFLENLSQYAKDTVICMDHDFKSQMNGIDLAKQLHEAGYTKLYLLSGTTFKKGETPDYLTVLLKGDMDALMRLVTDA